MRHYGHECYKPTLLWSTSPGIRVFSMGRLSKGAHPAKKKAAKTYQDAQGQSRFTGGAEMKASQMLGLQTNTRIRLMIYREKEKS